MRWGLFFLLVIFFVLLAYLGWIIYTQVRARRAGLPPPTWKSYIPFAFKSDTYPGSNFPSPRRGGVIGWVKDRLDSLRNKRTYQGAYEGPSRGGPGPYRGAAPDHDEAWDTRVGALEDGPYGQGPGPGPYGQYEQEFGTAPRREPYDTAGYDTGLSNVHDEAGRGRSRSRDPGEPPRVALTMPDSGKPLENPFDDHNASSLRDVSPRPVLETQPGK